jgi:hypothetical protein
VAWPTVAAGGVTSRPVGSTGAIAGRAIDSGTKRTGPKSRIPVIWGGVGLADAGGGAACFATVGADVAGADAAGTAGDGLDAAGLDAVGVDAADFDALAAGAEAVDAAEGFTVGAAGVTTIGVASMATAFSSRSIVT